MKIFKSIQQKFKESRQQNKKESESYWWSFMDLRVENKKLILGNEELKGVIHYEIRQSSNFPEGQAELELKMRVNFVGSDKEPNS